MYALKPIQDIEKYDLSSKDIDVADLGELRYMIVEIDTTFHDLIPYLLSPRQDLCNLYQFQKKGPPPASSSQPSTRSHCHGGRKRRKQNNGNRTRSQHNPENSRKTGEDDEHYGALLHLRSDISKESRRSIHHLIQKHRCFVTSTKSDITVELIPSSSATENNITTTAIVVGWSPQSFQRNRNKNKGAGKKLSSINNCEGNDSIQSNYSKSNILCVMKKTRQEHLVAIRHLTSAFKCRQSDIGLAGIKDMYAVTYQFCTIRNTALDQTYSANSYVQKWGIELGNFTEVNFSLNQGDLKGNHFKVIIRGIKRVNFQDATTSTVEGSVNISHPNMEDILDANKHLITERIEQLKKHGMINFFGEQRVGLADGIKKVGVQSYDIGRAMLKEVNFILYSCYL